MNSFLSKLNSSFTINPTAMATKERNKISLDGKLSTKVFRAEMNFLLFHLQLKNEKLSVCSLPREQKTNTAKKLKIFQKIASFLLNMAFLRTI